MKSTQKRIIRKKKLISEFLEMLRVRFLFREFTYQQNYKFFKLAYEKGTLAIYKVPDLEGTDPYTKFIIFDYMASTNPNKTQNKNGCPVAIKPTREEVNANGGLLPDRELEVDKEVIIYWTHRVNIISDFEVIDEATDNMIDTLEKIEIIQRAMSRPYVVVGDSTDSETTKFFNELDNNEPSLILPAQNVIKVLETPTNEATLYSLQNRYRLLRDELLNYLGYEALGVEEKKEHLINSEVNAKVDYVISRLSDYMQGLSHIAYRFQQMWAMVLTPLILINGGYVDFETGHKYYKIKGAGGFESEGGPSLAGVLLGDSISNSNSNNQSFRFGFSSPSGNDGFGGNYNGNTFFNGIGSGPNPTLWDWSSPINYYDILEHQNSLQNELNLNWQDPINYYDILRNENRINFSYLSHPIQALFFNDYNQSEIDFLKDEPPIYGLGSNPYNVTFQDRVDYLKYGIDKIKSYLKAGMALSSGPIITYLTLLYLNRIAMSVGNTNIFDAYEAEINRAFTDLYVNNGNNVENQELNFFGSVATAILPAGEISNNIAGRISAFTSFSVSPLKWIEEKFNSFYRYRAGQIISRLGKYITKRIVAEQVYRMVMRLTYKLSESLNADVSFGSAHNSALLAKSFIISTSSKSFKEFTAYSTANFVVYKAMEIIEKEDLINLKGFTGLISGLAASEVLEVTVNNLFTKIIDIIKDPDTTTRDKILNAGFGLIKHFGIGVKNLVVKSASKTGETFYGIGNKLYNLDFKGAQEILARYFLGIIDFFISLHEIYGIEQGERLTIEYVRGLRAGLGIERAMDRAFDVLKIDKKLLDDMTFYVRNLEQYNILQDYNVKANKNLKIGSAFTHKVINLKPEKVDFNLPSQVVHPTTTKEMENNMIIKKDAAIPDVLPDEIDNTYYPVDLNPYQQGEKIKAIVLPYPNFPYPGFDPKSDFFETDIMKLLYQLTKKFFNEPRNLADTVKYMIFGGKFQDYKDFNFPKAFDKIYQEFKKGDITIDEFTDSGSEYYKIIELCKLFYKQIQNSISLKELKKHLDEILILTK